MAASRHEVGFEDVFANIQDITLVLSVRIGCRESKTSDDAGVVAQRASDCHVSIHTFGRSLASLSFQGSNHHKHDVS